MNNCNQIRKLYHKYEALSVEESTALTEHIETCQLCQDYIAQLPVTKNKMQNMNKTTTINKTTVIALAQQHKRQKTLRMFIAAFGALSSIGAIIWFDSQQTLTSVGALVLAMWAMTSVIYFVVLNRQGSDDFKNQDGNQNLFANWQKDLKLKINIIRYVAPFALVQFLVLIAIILFKGAIYTNGLVIVFAISLTLTFYILYQFYFSLPNMRKELQMIEQE